MHPTVRAMLAAGTYISAADYLLAQRARAAFTRQCREILRNVDVLAGPMEAITAHRIDETEVRVGDRVLASSPALTQYTRPFNLTGFPAITVPCGFGDDGMPIGLQLAGRPFDEETVLRAAHAYEQATEWHHRRPPI